MKQLEKVCPVCSKRFPATNDRRVYCSNRCANKDWIAKHPRIKLGSP